MRGNLSVICHNIVLNTVFSPLKPTALRKFLSYCLDNTLTLPFRNYLKNY